jgi:hypothetical protein
MLSMLSLCAAVDVWYTTPGDVKRVFLFSDDDDDDDDDTSVFIVV